MRPPCMRSLRIKFSCLHNSKTARAKELIAPTYLVLKQLWREERLSTMTGRFGLWFAYGAFLLSSVSVFLSSFFFLAQSDKVATLRATDLGLSAAIDPMRICRQNPYMDFVQPSFEEIATKMDSWLDREQEIEKHLVGIGEKHNHDRLQVFEEMGTCDKTCVGGKCSEDESKILCGMDVIKEPCVVYSIGGNNMWDFERDLLKRNPNCEVHTFDCTGQKSRFKVPENIHFHHVCLGVKNVPAPANPTSYNENSVVGEIWTLEKMQSTLGHSRIDLLKMDIEGYEWPLLGSWPELFDIRSSSAVLPMQIAVEVHYQSQMEELSVSPSIDFKHSTDLVRLQSHLLKMGYATIINDLNPSCPHCTELTLMRIRCPKDPTHWLAFSSV